MAARLVVACVAATAVVGTAAVAAAEDGTVVYMNDDAFVYSPFNWALVPYDEPPPTSNHLSLGRSNAASALQVSRRQAV
jgi:hypothetical protein